MKKRKTKSLPEWIYDAGVLHNLQEQDIRLKHDIGNSTLVFTGRMSEQKTLKIPLFQVFVCRSPPFLKSGPIRFYENKFNREKCLGTTLLQSGHVRPKRFNVTCRLPS